MTNGAENPRRADSPDFSDSNANQASGNVTYGTDVSQIRGWFAILQGARFPTCLQQALKAVIANQLAHPSNPSDTLPAGASIGDTTVAQLSFPTLGDQSVAYRVTVPINFNGLSVDAYIDFVAIQKGRAVASFSFSGTSTPFSSEMAVQLSTLTVGRLVNT